jgi:hypothetical protein
MPTLLEIITDIGKLGRSTTLMLLEDEGAQNKMRFDTFLLWLHLPFDLYK